jgi:hypothetical protein
MGCSFSRSASTGLLHTISPALVRSSYARGGLDGVTLTVVRDEMEAEMLCGLLRSNGISCTYRKTNTAAAISAESGGFAMAGPTEVLVHEPDLDAARRLLARR